MKSVLILTYWNYRDALIQTYTLPYVMMIRRRVQAESDIYLVTMEKTSLSAEQSGEIDRELKSSGIVWVPLRYSPFGLLAIMRWASDLFKLASMIRRRNIDVVHAWATPAGAIGYLLAVVTGARLVVDSYEPHAESMVENGTWSKNGIAFRILFWLEKKQTERAQYLIMATGAMASYAQHKYKVSLPQNFVKPACVDLDLFSIANVKKPLLLSSLGLEGKLVCVYAGKFGGIYLEDEFFRFFEAAARRWKSRFRVLLLTNQDPGQIADYCERAGLDPKVIVQHFVAHRDVPDYMGLGDFAVTPVKPVASKRYCTPIKDGEYWALGLPVVITPGISDDSEIIEGHNAGAVIRDFDEAGFAKALTAIERIIDEPRVARFERIRGLAIKYRSFKIAKEVYGHIYGEEIN